MTTRVLIVDPNETNRHATEAGVAELGAVYQSVSDGREAWRVLRDADAQFDLVLSELQMPHLDGLALLQRFHAADLALPIAILSNEANVQAAIKALQLHAFDFLPRPFEMHQLHGLIKRARAARAPGTMGIERQLPEGFSEELRLTLPPRRQLIGDAVLHCSQHFGQLLRHWGMQPQTLRLCLNEALHNAVIHGALGVSSKLKEEDWEQFENQIVEREQALANSDHFIQLSIRINSAAMDIEVQDPGQGFDHRRLPTDLSQESLRASGRGLLLIKNAMDEVSWNDTGNVLRMRKYLRGAVERRPVSA